TPCTGTCRSCAVAGSPGTCSPVPAGQDPQGQCGDRGPASCGNDGFCDGAGACRNYAAGTACADPSCPGMTASAARSCDGDGFCNGSGGCRSYPAGTQCVAPSCAGTTATAARACNGTGTCNPGPTSTCTPYLCGPTACKTTCAGNADCAAPNVCIGTACGPM